MMMLRYHLHNLLSCFKQWHDARRCAARIDASLRAHGFVEVAPGRWEKRG